MPARRFSQLAYGICPFRDLGQKKPYKA